MASLIYSFILFAFQSLTSDQGPPQPKQSGSGGGIVNGPQTPIDDYIWIILVLGLCYGIYIAYKRSRAINNPS